MKLVGYCAEDDERGIQRLLVYEYMPNRSVEDHLSKRSEAPLSWTMRLKVAQDAARGLAYLHEEMDFQVLYNLIEKDSLQMECLDQRFRFSCRLFSEISNLPTFF